MHFDLNQEIFENKTKKAIWLFGRDLVPLEVSLANIPDERDKEGYTQVYRYTHNLFSDMYENPNEYRLYPPENVMFYGVAYYGNLLIDIVKSSELMEDGTLMMAASVYHKMLKKGVRKKDKSKFNRMSCLSRLGIDVREGMVSTVFESQRYPLLLEYYTRLQKQSQRYKLNCNSYVLSCDFRIFTKGYRHTIQNILDVLPERDRVYARVMHEYAIEKNLTVLPCQYYHRVSYRYKGNYAMEFNVFLRFDMCIQLKHAAHPESTEFDRFLELVRNQPNAEELMEYCVHNLNYCNCCFHSKTKQQRCGKWRDIYGHRRLVCGASISKQKGPEINCRYTDKDIPFLKQLLDLRLQVIDEMDS